MDAEPPPTAAMRAKGNALEQNHLSQSFRSIIGRRPRVVGDGDPSQGE